MAGGSSFFLFPSRLGADLPPSTFRNGMDRLGQGGNVGGSEGKRSGPRGAGRSRETVRLPSRPTPDDSLLSLGACRGGAFNLKSPLDTSNILKEIGNPLFSSY